MFELQISLPPSAVVFSQPVREMLFLNLLMAKGNHLLKKQPFGSACSCWM